ncbi:hypothetical protein K1719_027917 [Acacia pycnantha]|nr:hypothetical protein K1719_027917 [Acacia pycnantha]
MPQIHQDQTLEVTKTLRFQVRDGTRETTWRNFPYEYINNLPRANVNDGSMLILSVPLTVMGRSNREMGIINHSSLFKYLIRQQSREGFTFPALPEPVRSTTDYPTLVRELINRNRDLEDQLEQLQKQLQQLKDNESIVISCIIDSEPRSCISPNAIPKHFYEEMYGQKAKSPEIDQPTILIIGSRIIEHLRDGRYGIDQTLPFGSIRDGEYIYNGLLKLVINLVRPTQVLNGEECPIDYMEFLSYGMVANLFGIEDFKELPFGEALNEEIRKQQKYGTLFVKVRSQIPYYEKGKYRQNFHHFTVTPLIEQTEEGLSEPRCDKFLRDARLYESLGNKYAEDYNSLSFDTIVKNLVTGMDPQSCERLSLVQAGVLDPDPENYGDDGMFDDEYMADTIKV